jgi:hypothetical protein
MTKQRIGFVEKVEGDVAHALRRATIIFTRESEALPRYGRASVRSLATVGSARIVGTGVVVCYGAVEEEVARHILSTTDGTVVVVTKAKARKGGSIQDAIERAIASGRKVEQVVVKKGSAFAGDCAPGGVFEVVENVEAPIATSTAPSIPRREVRKIEVSRPRVPRKEVEVVEVSRPRLPRKEFVRSASPAPRLARPAVTGDRSLAASLPEPSASTSPSQAPDEPQDAETPSESPETSSRLLAPSDASEG